MFKLKRRTKLHSFRLQSTGLLVGVTHRARRRQNTTHSSVVVTIELIPPVSEGKTREVEIESSGDKGNRIARIDRDMS